MSATLAALGATTLLALVAFILAIKELTEYRLAERVRNAATGGAAPVAQTGFSGLGSVVDALLRAVNVSGLVRFLASTQDRTQVERALVPLGVPVSAAAPLLVVVKLLFLFGAPGLALAWHEFSERQGSILITGLFGLAVGVMAPNMLLNQLRKRRIAKLGRGLADALDLLVVCAEAGLGLESAIDRVAADMRRSNLALAIEFAVLGQEMRLLPDRALAMERFAERAEVDGLKRLAATLSQAMRYGTPLGQALRALAADERNQRMIRLEEKAARLPALLVLPLIMFILPPLFIVLVGPAFIQLMDSFGALT